MRTRRTYFIGAGFHLLHCWIHINVLKADATENFNGIKLLRNLSVQKQWSKENMPFKFPNSKSNPSLRIHSECTKPFSIIQKFQILALSNDIPQGPSLLCHFPKGHCHHFARKPTWNHELFGDHESMQGMPPKLHDSATILAGLN